MDAEYARWLDARFGHQDFVALDAEAKARRIATVAHELSTVLARRTSPRLRWWRHIGIFAALLLLVTAIWAGYVVWRAERIYREMVARGLPEELARDYAAQHVQQRYMPFLKGSKNES